MLNSPRWSDGYGSDGGRTVQKKEIRKRGKRENYYAACRYKGILIQDCLGTTDVRIAFQRLAELKFQIDKGEYQSWKKTGNETEVDYLKEDGRYEYIVRLHLRPFFSGKRIMEITNYDPKTGKSLVAEYFRIKGDLPKSSLKKHARVLKWILQRGDRNFEIPAIVYRNKGFYQKRCLSIAELEEIVSLLEDQHQSVALVMAYTGLDRADAIGLRWRNVDFKEGMIRTQRGKTGIKVDIPFTQVVRDVLQVRLRVRKLHDDSVFHTVTGQGFYKAWKRAVKRSSVDWGGARLSPKDLRHFFSNFMRNNGVDYLAIVALMGHKSAKMLIERYGHSDDDTLRKAVKVFDEIEGQSSNCLQIVCKN